MNDNTYFTVQKWMVTKLNLRTVERDVYAIIFGYSQDEESDFHGSISYLSELTGYSKNSICSALKSLTDKKLLVKIEETVNNVKVCRYRTSHLYSIQATCIPIQATCTGGIQATCMGIQATCTNNKIDNKDINNKIDNKEKEVEKFIDAYHERCSSLSKVRAVTDKRKKSIRSIMKKYTWEDIVTVFDSVEQSDFLTGKNDRGWKADIDFILREDKFLNILEGKYNSRKSRVASDSNSRYSYQDTTEAKRQLRKAIENGTAEKF